MLGTRLAGSTSPYRKVVQDEAPKAAKRLTARERSSLSRVIKNIVVASRRARQEEAGRRRRQRGWRFRSRRGVGAGVGAAQASVRSSGLEVVSAWSSCRTSWLVSSEGPSRAVQCPSRGGIVEGRL